MGYPGRLVALCTYALLEPATLWVVLEAICDAPTPLNLTTHSYYNLDGSADILAHHLLINGDHTTPTDRELIPTGAITPVADGGYDFRAPRPLRDAQWAAFDYDVNYVLRHAPGELGHAATLSSSQSGSPSRCGRRNPACSSTTATSWRCPVAGLEGAPYSRNGGLCLEPQRFPDGPNKAHFPPCILRPGAVSRQVSEMRFGPAA
jgi:aldose 1-epimerase